MIALLLAVAGCWVTPEGAFVLAQPPSEATCAEMVQLLRAVDVAEPCTDPLSCAAADRDGDGVVGPLDLAACNVLDGPRAACAALVHFYAGKKCIVP